MRRLAWLMSVATATACSDSGVTVVTGGDGSSSDDGDIAEPQPTTVGPSPDGDDGDPEPICGNGVLEPGEACDIEVGLKTCELFGQPPGELQCAGDCTLDFSLCGTMCGNGTIDPGEECDRADFGGLTCEDIDPEFEGGELNCSDDCVIELDECVTSCGNGEIDPGEQCDGVGSYECARLEGAGWIGEATCTPGCLWGQYECSLCGNGIAEPLETCDGAPESPSGQTRTCSNVLGFSSAGVLTCAPDCTADTSQCSLCGNGAVDGDEDCDMGPLDATCVDFGFSLGALGCNDDCTYDPSACTNCGDGIVDAGEVCDGMDLAGMACTDLGFAGGTLGCSPGCAWDVSGCGSCGDGIAVPGEACDGADMAGSTCSDVMPGLQAGTPLCNPDCTLAAGDCTAIEVGSVIITEILAAPLANPSFNDGQWFELYNTDPTRTWDLKGCEVQGTAIFEHFDIESSLLIAPGQYIAFGTGTDAELGFTPALQLPTNYSLANGGDTVGLHCGTVIVDEVDYDDMDPWPMDTNGVAIGYDPALIAFDNNGDGANWCSATTSYGLMQLGTPLAPNDPCE